MKETTKNSSWSSLQKIGFRFLFTYTLLFIVLYNNDAFAIFSDWFNGFSDWVKNILASIANSTGYFKYEVSISDNGSGDTMVHYLVVLLSFCLSIISALVWTFLDTKRKNYDTLNYYMVLAIRFYVGLMLFSYGLAKFYGQFPSPTFVDLNTPLGHNSKMGLAWLFFGVSKSYENFLGFVEILAILLLFRRTYVLGAFICLATTVNIVMVNYMFGVSVKLLASHLLFFCIVLLFPYLKQIYHFFMGNTVRLQNKILQFKLFPKYPRFQKVKPFIVLLLLFGNLYENNKLYQDFYKELEDNKYRGFYVVDSVIKGKDTIPTKKIKNFTYDYVDWHYTNYVSIITEDFSPSYQYVVPDMDKNEILMYYSSANSSKKDTVRYATRFMEETLLLKGKIAQDSVFIKMTRKENPLDDYWLIKDSFRWINN